MPLLQKIRRPTVRILGTEYSARIVGLHNRLRAHAGRLHVYKDLRRYPGGAAPGTRGVFVPGKRRLVIYLRAGAPEVTVAHEIVHAILYTEGFLPLRCRTEDRAARPEIAFLARALNDLLVHPVVLDRLLRAGFGHEGAGADGILPPADGGPAPRAAIPGAAAGSSRRRTPLAMGPPRDRGAGAEEARALRLLALAVASAERLHRVGVREVESGLEKHAHGLAGLAREIAGSAPWDKGRTPLDARVRAAEIVARLEAAAGKLFSIRLGLPERILMAPHLTRRRLAAPAGSLFDVRAAWTDGSVVMVVFRPDGTACSARAYGSAEHAARAAGAVATEMAGMSAGAFVERHRLEHLVIEGGRRYRPRWPGR